MTSLYNIAIVTLFLAALVAIGIGLWEIDPALAKVVMGVIIGALIIVGRVRIARRRERDGE